METTKVEQRPWWRRRRPGDERGSVLVAAVAISFVVVVLGATAISQTVSGVTQSGIANKQVNSVDAAEDGLNVVEASMEAQGAAGQTTFNCPSGSQSVPGGGVASFSLSYTSYVTTSGAPTTPTFSACPGSSTPLNGGYTYLIRSTGTTTATSTFGSRVEEAQIVVPSAVVYGQSGQYKEALFAGDTILPSVTPLGSPGSFTLTGGDTYSGGLGLCASNWGFGGNYFSNGIPVTTGILPIGFTLPTALAGACNVSGNLYMNNSAGINITSGSGVGGSVYSSGAVLMNGGADVGGSLYSTSGGVSLNAGTTIGGSVYSGDSLLGVTTSGGPIVTGTVNSAGPVTLVNGTYGTASTTNEIYGSSVNASSATVNGNVDSTGPVTLTSGTYTGAIYGSSVSASSATVGGNVYSTGAVTLTSGTYNGSIYADGLVTIQGGATVNGTIFTDGGVSDLNGTIGTVEDNGGPLTYLAKASGPAYWTNLAVAPSSLPYFGPTSFIKGLPAGFPLPYTSTVAAITAASVGTVVQSQIVAVANTVNGTTGGTTSTVSFPSLSYDQNAWLDDTSFCGAATCTTSTMNFEVVDATTQAGCAPLWSDITALEVSGAKPTVIQTNCQFTWGTSYTSYNPIALFNNLAIFDTAGFTLPSSFSGFKAGDGKAHQLFMIVPSSSTTIPNLGLPNVYAATLLNTIFGTEYPNGEATCSLLDGPDISVATALTDGNIEDFLYTPANVCEPVSGGNVSVYGKIYAGQSFTPGSDWSLKYYDIDPWSQSNGNGNQVTNTPGTPVVQYVSQASSS